MANPRLLVTRFSPQGIELADALNEAGIYSIAEPLLEVRQVADAHFPFGLDYDVIIAISRNAVKFTDASLKGVDWPKSCYLAVGNATASLLKDKSKQNVIVPSLSFDSEGLLALEQLKSVQNRSILILRGVGGREFLYDELLKRGARVDYYETYQRVAIKLTRSISVHKWQQQGINGAIISSIELLQQLIAIVDDADSAWLKSLSLYVASERILNYALLLGFKKVQLLPGSANQKIIDYFTNEGCYE